MLNTLVTSAAGRVLLLVLLAAQFHALGQTQDTGNRVLVFGSSTAAGVGASQYQRSWAGRLARELQTRGYTVSNRSVGGDDTAKMIARFDRDVAPVRPQVVVLASSLYNEPQGRGAEMYGSYIHNVSTLLRLVESIGARAIVMGPYPIDTATPAMRDAAPLAYRSLRTYGIAHWNVLGSTVDTATGHWLQGLSDDGVHPNDVGHAAMFDAIPLSAFTVQPEQAPFDPMATKGGRWRADALNLPLRVKLDRRAGTWSVGGWFKAAPQGYSRPLLAVEDGAASVTLHASGDNVLIQQNGLDVITASVDAAAWQHIVVIYRGLINRVDLYINAVLVGHAAVAAPVGATQVYFLSTAGSAADNCYTCSLADPVVYRTAMDEEAIRAMLIGNVTRGSVHFLGVFNGNGFTNILYNGAVLEQFSPSWVPDTTEWSGAVACYERPSRTNVLAQQTPSCAVPGKMATPGNTDHIQSDK